MADCRIVLRKTELTESAAPAQARQTAPTHSAVPRSTSEPAPATASPKPVIDDPPQRHGHHDRHALAHAPPPSRPEKTIARTEPTATAADIRPTVLAPPPNASAATAREQRPRLRQDHRAEVGEEGHPHVRAGAEEAQPVEHARQARAAARGAVAGWSSVGSASGGIGSSRSSPHMANVNSAASNV